MDRSWYDRMRDAGVGVLITGVAAAAPGCSLLQNSSPGSRWVGYDTPGQSPRDTTEQVAEEQEGSTYGVMRGRRDSSRARRVNDGEDTYGVMLVADTADAGRVKEDDRKDREGAGPGGIVGERGGEREPGLRDTTREDAGVDKRKDSRRDAKKGLDEDDEGTKRMEKPSVRMKGDKKDVPMVGSTVDRYEEESYSLDPEVSDGITGEIVLKYEKESGSLAAVVGDLTNNSRGDPVTRYGGSGDSPAYSYRDILGADVDSLAGLLAADPAEREDVARHFEDHAESLGRLHIYREAIEQNREEMGEDVYEAARKVVMDDIGYAMDRLESVVDDVYVSYRGPDVENEEDVSPYTVAIEAQERRTQW